ncbi:MAG: class II aldolase/adducin family protein [Lentisphaeria bacterium]
MDNLLQDIATLSREFGAPEYVKGGGGNTSVKNEETVWIKPSGTTLASIRKDDFVPLDRQKVEYLFEFTPPSQPVKREAAVKKLMKETVATETTARPSVEAPLHHCFESTFVVHTHPPLVNGMLCAQNGKEACQQLFPADLWIDYVDPGYTLSVTVREKLDLFRRHNGKQPDAVFIQNHGIFVGADRVEDVRRIHSAIMDKLAEYYHEKGISRTLSTGAKPYQQRMEKIRTNFINITGGDNIHVTADGIFNVPEGPLTPDHIVYMKPYPLLGEPTPDNLKKFCDKYGYLPAIISTEDGVFAIGDSDNKARLALELARDGALVEQLAQAFGGIKYLTEEQRDFIVNWEVEAYRKKQTG